MYNADFKVVEFDHFKMQAGLPSFVLGPGQWIEKTNAIGMYVRSGRYGGTYAHKDIAFEFCSAVNPVFKLGGFRGTLFNCLIKKPSFNNQTTSRAPTLVWAYIVSPLSHERSGEESKKRQTGTETTGRLAKPANDLGEGYGTTNKFT
jgi:hypothetical protein